MPNGFDIPSVRNDVTETVAYSDTEINKRQKVSPIFPISPLTPEEGNETTIIDLFFNKAI
jgi:hypothetical protein